MKREARKILLPVMEMTEVTDENDCGAIKVVLPQTGSHLEYYLRKKHDAATGDRKDNKPIWMGSKFNLYPVVLDKNGAPWAEANIYLMSRIESSIDPVMSTFSSIADSLAAFRRFLDETEIDWIEFPQQKLKRPTYRFFGYLKLKIASGKMKDSTAKRHMSAVISFYSWLIKDKALNPTNSPWQASESFIQLADARGFKFSKQVISTDISIKRSDSHDPYDDHISDGGKLRPLIKQEQEWLIDALIELENTEMLLIHLIGLLTGSRIQTILTLRLKHIAAQIDTDNFGEVRIPVGPGTDTDTKNNKKLVLHFPGWLYQKLHIYANSERAQKRRARAKGRNTNDQYLFLSMRGSPFYMSKAESLIFDASHSKRHAKTGQAVRQFITDKVIPLIRSKFNAPNFSYQFHDTRATYGMNLTDCQLERVNMGEITLHQAREFVKARMGHQSPATTDKYLQYRSNHQLASNINIKYDEHLRKLTEGNFQ